MKKCAFVMMMIAAIGVPAATGGYGQDAAATQGMKDVQVGHAPAEEGGLKLKIEAIHKEHVLDKLPGGSKLQKGGTWTVLDCVVTDLPEAKIAIAVESVMAKGERFSWNNAAIYPRDEKGGAAFLDAFGKAFHAKLPPARKGVLNRPFSFPSVILGANMGRDETRGTFSGKGTWVATKWFVQLGGAEAEVFFNYNETTKEAEFSEKDEDYRDDLGKLFAVFVRDGRVAQRSSKEDAQITTTGPHFGNLHEGMIFSKGKFIPLEFHDGGKFLTYIQDRKSLMEVALYEKIPKPVTVTTWFEKSLIAAYIGGPDDALYLAEEALTDGPGYSSEDDKRLWIVSRVSHKRSELKGSWPAKDVRAGAQAISPDGKYVVVFAMTRDKENVGKDMAYITELETRKVVTADLGDRYSAALQWTGKEDSLQLLVRSETWVRGRDTKVEFFSIDPRTGKVAEAKASTEPDASISPDGKWKNRIEKGKLIVTNLRDKSEREFVIHADDLPSVEGMTHVSWISPGYMRAPSPYPGFISVETMKMSYFLPGTYEDMPLMFGPDLKWCVITFNTGQMTLMPLVISDLDVK